jgi:hypothetical protein
VPAPPNRKRQARTKMPICSTGAGGLAGAIVVSIAIVGGGGMVAMLDATTSGVGGAGRSSFFTPSFGAGSGATGIRWLMELFSGRPASSSRTRRMSYAGVSMYLFGTSTTCAPLLLSMPFSQSRFSFIR